MARTSEESFSTTASDQTKAALLRILQQMDSLVDVRDATVRQAMTDYRAHGVSDEYVEAEARWRRASAGLRSTIATLRSALVAADATAADALARARVAASALDAP